MAASATSSTAHIKACLILNLGTQEPRYRVNSGKFLLMGQDEPEAAQVRQELGVEEAGLWYATRKLCETWSDNAHEKLRFPIAACSIRKLLEWNSGRMASQVIDKLVLVVTGAETKGPYQENSPANDDTWYAGQLLIKYLRQAPRFKGSIADTHICALGPSPHLWSESLRYIDQDTFFKNELGKYTQIWVCQSPGLPMANAAVLRRALKVNRHRVTAFQVVEPSEASLREGAESNQIVGVPTVVLLYDWAFDLLPELLKRFDYQGAEELLRSCGRHPDEQFRTKIGQMVYLLRQARARWVLDLDNTGLGLPGDGLARVLVRVWLSCDIVEALVANENYTEALRQAGDIVGFLDEAALALAANKPDLILQRTGSGRRKVLDELDKLKKDPPFDTTWTPFREGLDCWRTLRRLRNDLVHAFVPVTEADFQDACGAAAVTSDQLAAKLRELLRKFWEKAELRGSLPEAEPFRQLNEKILRYTQPAGRTR